MTIPETSQLFQEICRKLCNDCKTIDETYQKKHALGVRRYTRTGIQYDQR